MPPGVVVAVPKLALAAVAAGVAALSQKTASAQGEPCTTPTSLAGGFVITRSCVDDRAAIGQDLKGVWNALTSDPPDFNRANFLYTAGENSIKPGGETRTLQGFSTSAENGKFDTNPTYQFIRYGLADMVKEDMDDYTTFADEFVKTKLANQNSGTLAYEAMVALNVYTYCMYELWDMVEDCARAEALGEDSVTDNLGQGIFALDEFIAFYIGDPQVSGSEDGYSLYALAQVIGKRFGKNDPAAEVNMNIKNLYERGLQQLSYADACTAGSDTVGLLHGIVNNILSQMAVIMMQNLLQAIYQEDQDRITLYATALVPQLAACKPSTYRYLKSTLLDQTYDEQNYLKVLGQLQSTYECLGFSCADVGTYTDPISGGSAIGQCSDLPSTLPMAGYTPDTDTHQHALIDGDVLEIKGLTTMEMWTAAERLYKFGKHSTKGDELRNLHTMATSLNREKAVPYYQIFKKYYSDPDYGNTFVMEALDADGKWASASPAQRKEIVVKTIQYQIVYMYAMYEFRDAVDDCRNGNQMDNVDAVSAFDEGAAFLIGSLEGTQVGGAPDTDDGMLHYNLGQKRAEQFGRYADTNGDGVETARVNEDLIELLWAGKTEASTGACDELAKTVDEIMHITLIPLMQGVIRYAIKNEKHTAPFEERSKDLAEGEAFTKSLLPLVCDVDSDACQTLEVNMLMEEDRKPVSAGPQAVADALQVLCNSDLYDHIDCSQVGSAEGVTVAAAGARTNSPGSYVDVGQSLEVTVLAVSSWLLYLNAV